MSEYTVTVIKTGNSYALRVPKAYVVDGGLALGQKVEVSLPKNDQVRIINKIVQPLNKPFKSCRNRILW
ncbi:hypothetical protein IPG36_02165 [bacterium]|nr:MAG: hypothetical protein IPG36_02165 [bacterium]